MKRQGRNTQKGKATREVLEARIQRVLDSMGADEVDRLASGDGLGETDTVEFKVIADAVMAWWTLLVGSGIVKRTGEAERILASSGLVLATVVKYGYAMGRKSGQLAAVSPTGGTGGQVKTPDCGPAGANTGG